MFEKKKAKTRSLKQWTRPHRSRLKWRAENITLGFLIRVFLLVFGIAYFAGFAVSVSLDETTGNPIKMIQLVAGIFSEEDPNASVTPAQTEESSEAVTTEAATTEAPTTEAPTTEAPTTEAPATEAPSTEASKPAESTPAESTPAESTPAESSPSESSQTETSPAETTKAQEIDENANYAIVYTDENYTVKLRSQAMIPVDDKTANIMAEVSSEAQLKVKVLGDAGESNGHKWSKVELIEDLEKSELVKISDGVLLKAGTVCYICTTYLKNVQ